MYPNSSKKILLYGGSFDPIHNGHLHIAREAAYKIDADKVIFIPAGIPPHKLDREITPPYTRFEMIQRAIEFESLFTVSDYETTMDSPSFSVHTVRFFRSQFRHCELFWLIGGDSFSQLAKWYLVDKLVDLCTIVTVGRPGFALDTEPLKARLTNDQIDKLKSHIVDIPLTGESSTAIRDKVAKGESISDMVPAAVAEYINANSLYR